MPRLLGFGIFVFSVMLLARPALGDDAAQRLLEHKELVLTGYQKNTIRSDLPARAIAAESSTGSVVVLGRTSLWNWQVERQTLSRVNLVKPGEARTQRLSELIELGTGEWLVVGDRALFRVALTPELKVLRFEYPEYVNGRSLGHGLSKDEFWWLHSDGIAVLNLASNILTKPFPRSVLKASDRAFANPTTRQVFVMRKNLIIRKDLATPQVTTHLIHKGVHAFNELVGLGDDVVVRTARTVLRLAPTGALQQAIPVEGQRALVSMSLGGPDHGYVFNDGLLEVYRLGNESSAKYRLELEPHSQVHRLAVDGPLAALIIDGEPRVHLLF